MPPPLGDLIDTQPRIIEKTPVPPPPRPKVPPKKASPPLLKQAPPPKKAPPPLLKNPSWGFKGDEVIRPNVVTVDQVSWPERAPPPMKGPPMKGPGPPPNVHADIISQTCVVGPGRCPHARQPQLQGQSEPGAFWHHSRWMSPMQQGTPSPCLWIRIGKSR